MPAHAKTTDAAIVDATRELIERCGTDVSMGDIAAAVGVAPSALYKRFGGRDDLIADVRVAAYGMLREALLRAESEAAPKVRLRAMAHAYVGFAHDHARLYDLLFRFETERRPTHTAARRAAVQPVLDELIPLVGDDALHALRLLAAFLHGHVAIALAGGFGDEASAEASFRFGLERILDAVTAGNFAAPHG